MTSAGRWTIIVVVLAVAGIVALWPREGGGEQAPNAPSSPGATRSAGPAESDAALAQLRQRAALQPCPKPVPGSAAPAGPLAGVSAGCLGRPGTVDLGAALAGQPALLNVWASWCQPCREEMPVLAAYAAQPGSIPVLGVHVQEPASDGLAFMADIGVRYPSVHDGSSAVQRALGVPPILPVNYLVRPDGSLQRITQPLVFRSADQVAAAVRRELGQQR